MKQVVLTILFGILCAGCASSRGPLTGMWRNVNKELSYTMALSPKGTFRESSVYQSKLGRWKRRGNQLILSVKEIKSAMGSPTLRPPYTLKLDIVSLSDDSLVLKTQAGRRIDLTKEP